MEFLYQLYSNNYFGIGLFIVIAILAFVFLIVLFFGKKDEKNRIKKQKQTNEKLKSDNIEVSQEQQIDSLDSTVLKEEPSLELEETVKEELIETEPMFTNEESQEKLEIFEETPREQLDPFATSNLVLNTDFIQEENNDYKQEEEEKKDSDFYDFDSILDKEEINGESIDEVLNKYDAIEETVLEQPNLEAFENIVVEENLVEDVDKELDVFTKTNNLSAKTSTPFSSVYLTKEESDNRKEEKEFATISTKPTFDLPKKVELPKKNSNAINENIISLMKEQNEDTKIDEK